MIPGDRWVLNPVRLPLLWIDNPTGYIVENMRYFNSRQRDFSPAYVNDDYNEVFFTSTREDATGNDTHGATGQNFADMFSSSMRQEGKMECTGSGGKPELGV